MQICRRAQDLIAIYENFFFNEMKTISKEKWILNRIVRKSWYLENHFLAKGMFYVMKINYHEGKAVSLPKYSKKF